MRVVEFLFDSEAATATGRQVSTLVGERPETVETTDLGTATGRDDARREAMLSVGAATRIGSKPDALFDDEGDPDFSAGAIIVEEETGRRDLYVGERAVEILTED